MSAPSDEDADDEDNGRTVIRGAPKIVKRNTANARNQNAPSPAAVIKATLESARANRLIMPGPPADLLEDHDDFTENVPSQRAPFVGRLSDRTFNDYEGPPSHRPPPMSFEGPPSHPPSSHNPFHGNTMQSSHRGGHRMDDGPPSSRPGAYAQQQQQQPQTYGPPPQASVPGVVPAAMPAHFMTPQAPYADPPGTSVTSGHRVAGRPAVSWAAALLAFGLFVGVAAVAVIQSSDSVADTTASFVDPARAPAKQGPAGPVVPPTPVPVDARGNPVAVTPGGVIGASPVQPQPPAPVDPAVASTPVVATPGQPGIAFAPVPVKPTAAHPHFRAAPPPAKPAAPAAPPKGAVASNDDDKPAKPKKPEKPDDETKKALEQLQKAQLESAASF